MQNSDLKSFLTILRKRLWMIVLLFAVTMSVILFSALTAKPMYSASIRLQVIAMESEQVALYKAIQTSNADVIDLTAYQFQQTVKSGTIAWKTIANLGLNMDAKQLLDDVTTSQDGEFVTIVVQADSPQGAAEIATSMMETALAAYRADKARPAAVTGEFLTEQLKVSEQELSAANAELLRFKVDHSVDSLEREITAYQDTIRDLRRSQEDATLAIAQLTARIQTLESEVTTAETEAAAAEPESVERGQAQARAGELRDELARLRVDLSAQRALQAEYDRTIARWETELTSLIGLSDEYGRLTDAVSLARDTHDFLLSKSLEAELKQQQGLSVGYLKVVDPARRSDEPIPSKMIQIAAIGGVLSLVAGAALAFIFELIENSLRNPRRRGTGN